MAAPCTDLVEFTRFTDVVAKLPQKRTRQYIFDMLTKIKYPFRNFEGIVVGRGGLVDLTSVTREQAQALAAALNKHPDVECARMNGSEYTDVKISWIPGRFQSSRIIAALEARHGKVYLTKFVLPLRFP